MGWSVPCAVFLLAISGWDAPKLAAAQSAPFCGPSGLPAFVFGFAALREQVGEAMGAAIECEQTNLDSGDTLQQTTTGLSFYRKSTNTPTFTNGSDHWGLTADGLVTWSGSSIDPPGAVPPPAAQSAQPDVAPPLATTPIALSEADIAAHLAPSVVQVLTADGAGSGVCGRGGPDQ